MREPVMALDLPRRLLWGSAAVSFLALLVAVALATWRADRDVRGEMQAAMDLALVLQRAHLLTADPDLEDDDRAVQTLRSAVDDRNLRHLAITLRDEAGQRLWAVSADEPASAWMRWVVDQHRRWKGGDDPAPAYMPLRRPSGAEWSLVISPSPDSERLKAVSGMLQLLAVLTAGSLLLLTVMALQIRWLMRPMSAMLGALVRIRQGRLDAAGGLPPSELREFQVVAQAIEELGVALQNAEADRQVMAQRMLTLQEDERRHIAQELHDELGQRLTALRLDAAVLQRRLASLSPAAVDGAATPAWAGSPIESLQALAAGLVDQVQQAQQEIRHLLVRLAPRADEYQAAERLHQMLRDLIDHRPTPALPTIDLRCDLGDGVLPMDLIMAIYRMSQESLTNAWRHAQASHVQLTLRRQGARVLWSCRDDGAGITDLSQAFRRGNGLAGLRQRAWAFGGDLQVQDAQPGLMLQASLGIEPSSTHKT